MISRSSTANIKGWSWASTGSSENALTLSINLAIQARTNATCWLSVVERRLDFGPIRLDRLSWSSVLSAQARMNALNASLHWSALMDKASRSEDVRRTETTDVALLPCLVSASPPLDGDMANLSVGVRCQRQDEACLLDLACLVKDWLAVSATASTYMSVTL